jgi:heme/copper-type cytochrome/quinol oxidase subunit 2
MLVALVWINFRRHGVRLLKATADTGEPAFLGLNMMVWILLVGALITTAMLYVLYRYLRGDRGLVPNSAFGKGALITLLLLWMTAALQLFDGLPAAAHLFGHLLLWVPAAVATILLVSFSPSAQHARVPRTANATPSDPKWGTGVHFVAVCCAVPCILYAIACANTSMQDEPLKGHARKRFGPDAYYNTAGRLKGTWQAVHFSNDLEQTETRQVELPVTRLFFDRNLNVVATMPSGQEVTAHRWSLMNQYMWLDWYDRVPEHPDKARTPLRFHGENLLIAWPPKTGSDGFLVFERLED